jgi:hypothetical protein
MKSLIWEDIKTQHPTRENVRIKDVLLRVDSTLIKDTENDRERKQRLLFSNIKRF